MKDEFRLLQDGMVVASATSPVDIMHYALMYGRDGPVFIQARVNGRWREVEAALNEASRSSPSGQ
jgi:hypothetical protein